MSDEGRVKALPMDKVLGLTLPSTEKDGAEKICHCDVRQTCSQPLGLLAASTLLRMINSARSHALKKARVTGRVLSAPRRRISVCLERRISSRALHLNI